MILINILVLYKLIYKADLAARWVGYTFLSQRKRLSVSGSIAHSDSCVIFIECSPASSDFLFPVHSTYRQPFLRKARSYRLESPIKYTLPKELQAL